ITKRSSIFVVFNDRKNEAAKAASQQTKQHVCRKLTPNPRAVACFLPQKRTVNTHPHSAYLTLMNDDIHLRLLQLLQQSPHLSQRELAAELGSSLVKVNYCVRALVDKGWAKMNDFRRSDNKSAYNYQLTSQGSAEKA